jgi:hypothetical protein
VADKHGDRSVNGFPQEAFEFSTLALHNNRIGFTPIKYTSRHRDPMKRWLLNWGNSAHESPHQP